MIKVYLNITMSKIMGYLILILAFIMDLLNDREGTVFMFAIPFVSALIVGKQYFERNEKT
jgi:hypothetical protein